MLMEPDDVRAETHQLKETVDRARALLEKSRATTPKRTGGGAPSQAAATATAAHSVSPPPRAPTSRVVPVAPVLRPRSIVTGAAVATDSDIVADHQAALLEVQELRRTLDAMGDVEQRIRDAADEAAAATRAKMQAELHQTKLDSQRAQQSLRDANIKMSHDLQARDDRIASLNELLRSKDHASGEAESPRRTQKLQDQVSFLTAELLRRETLLDDKVVLIKKLEKRNGELEVAVEQWHRSSLDAQSIAEASRRDLEKSHESFQRQMKDLQVDMDAMKRKLADAELLELQLRRALANEQSLQAHMCIDHETVLRAEIEKDAEAEICATQESLKSVAALSHVQDDLRLVLQSGAEFATRVTESMTRRSDTVLAARSFHTWLRFALERCRMRQSHFAALSQEEVITRLQISEETEWSFACVVSSTMRTLWETLKRHELARADQRLISLKVTAERDELRKLNLTQGSQIGFLESQLHDAERDVEALRSTLVESEQRSNALATTASNDLVVSQERVDRLQGSLEALEVLLQTERDSAAATIASAARTQQLLDEQTLRNAELSASQVRFEQELHGLRELATHLESTNETVMADHEARLAVWEQEREKLHSRAAAAEEAIVAETKLRAELVASQTLATSQLEEVCARFSELQEKHVKLSDELVSTQRQLEAARSALTAQVSIMSASRKESPSPQAGDAETLKSLLESCQQQLQFSESEVTWWKEQSEALRVECDREKDNLRSDRADVLKLKAAEAALRGEVESLRSSEASLMAQLDAARREQRVAAAEWHKSRQAHEAAQLQLARLEAKLATLDGERSYLASLVTDSGSRATSERQLLQDEVARLEGQLHRTENELLRLSSAVSAPCQSCEQKSHSIATLEKQVEHLHEELSDVQAFSREMQDAYSSLASAAPANDPLTTSSSCAKCDALSQQLMAARGDAGRLREQLQVAAAVGVENANATVACLQDQVLELQRVNDELRTRADQIVVSRDLVQTRLEALLREQVPATSRPAQTVGDTPVERLLFIVQLIRALTPNEATRSDHASSLDHVLDACNRLLRQQHSVVTDDVRAIERKLISSVASLTPRSAAAHSPLLPSAHSADSRRVEEIEAALATLALAHEREVAALRSACRKSFEREGVTSRSQSASATKDDSQWRRCVEQWSNRYHLCQAFYRWASSREIAKRKRVAETANRTIACLQDQQRKLRDIANAAVERCRSLEGHARRQ